MALMRIQARFPRDGGAPEDDIVNVWHFDGDQSFGDDADDTVDRLHVFYQAIQTYLGSILTGAVHYKVYDMEATPPRVPVYEDATQTITPSTSRLPAELAICLSFHAEAVSGLNQKRRRGRIFLGPISEAAITFSGGAPDVHVSTAAITDITAAAAALATGPDAGDARLAVYSPTTDLTGTTADAFNDVTGGWVDNALDIQRRRGSKATVRTTWVPA